MTLELTKEEGSLLIEAALTACDRWRDVKGLPIDLYGLLCGKRQTLQELVIRITRQVTND